MILALVLLGGLAEPAWAQDEMLAEVISIWRGDEPADATRPGDLCWQHGSDLYESDVLAVGDVLGLGDILSRGPCPAIWQTDPEALDDDLDPTMLQIGLRCDDGTELIVSGPKFLAMVLDPLDAVEVWGSERQDCAVDLAQGTLDVIAEKSMVVHSGGVTIGVEGTQFTVERVVSQMRSSSFDAAIRGFEGTSDVHAGEAVVCRLFEGRVRLSVPDHPVRSGQILEPGRQWLRLDGVTDEAALHPESVVQTAERLAQADVARGWNAGTMDRQRSGCVPCEAVQEALPAYVEALRRGDDRAARWDLAHRLDALGLTDAADRERRRFTSTESGPEPQPEANGATSTSPCPPLDASGVGECPDLAQQITGPASQRLVLPRTEGVVVLDLPQPLRAGETVAGYMTVSGAGDGRRAKSGVRKMSKLHVTVGDATLPVQEGPWSLPMPDTPPKTSSLVISLRNPRGKTLVERSVELLEATPTAVPTHFTVSDLCHADKSLIVSGPFDGDPSNTQVLLGGKKLMRQAERPGQLVVACPETAGGSTSLDIVEGPLQHRVERFRNIEVELKVERTSLKRGQRTRATVTVRGLQGRDHPLGLRVLNTVPTVIRMQGGDARFFTLSPSAWGDGDTYSRSFELVALRDGTAKLRVEPVALP